MFIFILRIKDLLYVRHIYVESFILILSAKAFISLFISFHNNKENYSLVSEHMVIRITCVVCSDVLGQREAECVNINSCKTLRTDAVQRGILLS